MAAVLAMSSACTILSADEWILPEPASFHARGFSPVAEVFPPGSRQNSGSRARCFFYEMGYSGIRWDIKPTLKWQRELVNDRMPVEAILSMDGWFVTFNDWYAAGHAHAIVVYDPRGRLVADWSGDQLLTNPVLQPIARERSSVSSTWWNQRAKYYFTRDHLLFIAVAPDAIIRIDLTAGAFRVGRPSAFREYSGLLSDANAITEVWKTSLRFSSITDVLRAERGGRRTTGA